MSYPNKAQGGWRDLCSATVRSCIAAAKIDGFVCLGERGREAKGVSSVVVGWIGKKDFQFPVAAALLSDLPFLPQRGAKRT